MKSFASKLVLALLLVAINLHQAESRSVHLLYTKPTPPSPKFFLYFFKFHLTPFPPTFNCRAWVYTFVSADHGGDLLLPHFVNYYHQLGITYRRFLVLVHHSPGKGKSRQGLERLTGICQGYSLECRLWEGKYTADAHLEQQLLILRDFVDEPLDWIILANVDELQEWPTANINQFLSDENSETQVSYFTGEYVDRISQNKRLSPVLPVGIRSTTPSLFTQYPLRCIPNQYTVQSPRAERRERVIAFKAYLRADRERHRVIIPDAAKTYFSPCTPGRLCPRSSLNHLDMERGLWK